MNKTDIVLTFTIGIVVISVLINYEKHFDNMTYIKSNINDTEYRVRKLDDKESAVELLAETHEDLKKVCKMLEEEYPEDERIIRLKERFPYTTLCESDGYGGQTSYSVNKGEKIVLCMRSKDGTNKLVDKNLLLFVALHELSHIMTVSLNHTEEFWDNFKFVLENCQKHGLYKCINFERNPQSYCGITVTSSPYPCNK